MGAVCPPAREPKIAATKTLGTKSEAFAFRVSRGSFPLFSAIARKHRLPGGLLARSRLAKSVIAIPFFLCDLLAAMPLI
jgi:hypothetical protein